MIGIFILDEIPKVSKQLVLAHSKINDGISGYFYFRESDCVDVCSVDKGSEFFGILDDTSGFGACLFILNLELEKDNLLLQHNLHVKENTLIDKDLHVKGNTVVDGNTEIDGKTEIHDTLTVDNNIRGNANADITGNLNVNGNIVSKATITGKSPNTSIFLNPANVAMILGASMSGAPAPLQAVQVDMNNSI